MGWNNKHSRYMGPATAGAMLFGAVVGGVAAAAGNARKVQQGEMTRQQAALDALREAGTTGLSTGAGVAAMCRLGVGGFAGLVGITVVAAGTKYLLDSVVRDMLAKGCKACAPAAEEAPTVDLAAKSSGKSSSKSGAKSGAKAAAKAATKPAAKAPAKPKSAKQAKPAKPEPATTEAL